MNDDCEWMSSRLEDFFCDRLSAEDHEKAAAHIEGCMNCRADMESFEKVDRLVKAYFNKRLQEASQHRPRRALSLSYGTVAAALGSVLVVALVLWVPQIGKEIFPERASVSEQSPVEVEPMPVVKNQEEPPLIREKPQPAETLAETQSPKDSKSESAVAPGTARPAFLVTDPAGYSQTLQSYRGFVLVVGIFDRQQPQAIGNFQRLYEIFGGNPQLKILGVSTDRRSRPGGTTFPFAVNQGSRLLEARAAEFLIVDGSGTVRFRGSLLGDSSALVNNFRSLLEELGLR